MMLPNLLALRKSRFAPLCLIVVALFGGTAFSVTVPALSLESQLEREGLQGETFGSAVAMSGNVAVVGAPIRNSSAGTAYVYRWNGAKWAREAELTRTNPLPAEHFGGAVSIDGDTIAVGATGSDVPQADSGGVYVFVRTNGVWQQQAELHGSESTSDARFGSAVSVVGDQLVVGALNEFRGSYRTGVAYVFGRTGETWSERARLFASDGFANHRFGESVAQIGGEVLVGAPARSVGADEGVGAVYTFPVSGDGWTVGPTLTAPDGGENDWFGVAMAAFGNKLVIGMPLNQSINYHAGAIYTYLRTAEGWSYGGKIFSPDNEAKENFGAAIALHWDLLVVGSPYLNSDTGIGLAHVFEWDGGNWVRRYRLLPADGSSNDRFGFAIATNGDRVLIGSRYHAVSGQLSAGSVYAHTLSPPTPGGTEATPLSATRIRVVWRDETVREEGFEVYRRTGAAGAFTLVGAVGADTTEYIDEGLIAETDYAYQVRAFNADSYSSYGATAGATTLPNPPAAPSTLVAEGLSPSEIRLDWMDNSANETRFRLERSSDGTTFSTVATPSTNTTTHTDRELTPGSTFHYRVSAENAGGSSPYSNTVQASVLPSPPAPPTGLQAEPLSSTAIQLTWTDASDNADGFEVERSDNEGDTFSQITKVGTGTTEYRSGGLLPGTIYVYRVRAFNAGGTSAYSETAEVATLPAKPSAPAGLTAAVVGASVQLDWADTGGLETAYRVERRKGSGAYQEIAFLPADTSTYTDETVLPASHYAYRVRAWNEGGNSAYSNEAEVTTPAGPPSAPAGLAATVASTSRIDLTWTDASDTETGFRVERRLPSQSFQAIADLEAGTTSYTSEGLAADTTYLYRVRAFNGSGVSAPSDEVSATTLPAPPEAPSDLTATLISPREVRLDWTDTSANESAFKLERRKGNGAFGPVATLGANNTTFRDAGLETGTEYHYRLRATNAGGESANSDEASVTTPEAVPEPPSGLEAVAVTSGRIDLAWVDASDNETGFRVERRTAGSSFTLRAEKAAGATSHSDEGLTAGTTYFYRVRAFNAGGVSAPSDEVSATPPPLPPTAPNPPANLSVEVVSGSVLRLEWEDRSDNESGFRIERSVNGGSFAPLVEVGANTSFYRNTGLTAGTIYSYKVRAFNAGGESAFSNTAGATTLPPPPAVPTGLTATALSAAEIRLDWTDASNNESGFRLERKVGGGPFAQWVTLGANTVTFRDAGLQAATEYTYRLRAINAGGESGSSTEASATTLPLPPVGPTTLTVAVVSLHEIDVTWSDASNNETGFEVERRGVGGPFARISHPGAGITTYRDSGLSPNTTYLYRVRAVNAGGASGYSYEAAGTTLPSPPPTPYGVWVTPLSTTSMRLEWPDRSDLETGFRIERATGSGGSFQPVDTVGANVITYWDGGLAPDQLYRYRVIAVNAGGESMPSEIVAARTHAVPPPAPTAPALLNAEAVSSRSIRLTWIDASDNETGFEVERRTGFVTGIGPFQTVAVLASNATEFVDVGLAPATSYVYRVRAVNAGVGSAYTSIEEASTHPEAPTAPESLEVQPLSRVSLRLTWVDASSNETEFEVQHRGADGLWSTVGRLAANATTFEHNGLQPGSTHTYRVRAVNAGGASAYSGTATGKTYALTSPTKLVARRATVTQIKLTWADSTQGEAGFAVERRTTSTGFVEVKRVRAGAKTYTDARLTRGETYTYRVRAFQADGGVSAYSNEAAVPLPAAVVKVKRKGR